MYRLVVVMLFFCHLIGADAFLIGGWGAENLHQADSCGINTSMFWCQPSTVNGLFNTAETLGMKIILGNARLLGDTVAHSITHMARGQWSRYEAEDDSFTHNLGAAVDGAWAVCGGSAGWLQQGPWTTQQSQFWDSIMVYNALFNLRTDDTVHTAPLCILYVRKKHQDTIYTLDTHQLAQVDFAYPDSFQEFSLSFTMERFEFSEIDCGIWYTGTNDSLYSDRVDIRDVIADSLKGEYYDTIIGDITDYYNPKSAMFRYG